jgi:hypothetical protein
MENDTFRFQIADFSPHTDLLQESWDYHFFYFLARYAFAINEHNTPFEFFIDDFLLAMAMSDISIPDKNLTTILHQWCVPENPYLAFGIHPETLAPVIIMKPLHMNKRYTIDTDETITLNRELIENIKTCGDFRFLSDTIQACDSHD